jgi:hypothetical protein
MECVKILEADEVENLKRIYEYCPQHARWMGRSRPHATRSQWSWIVPVVLPGSAGPAIYLLLGVLRTRMETSITARIFAGTHTQTGPGPLRSLLY